jgi:hypothetical protein
MSSEYHAPELEALEGCLDYCAREALRAYSTIDPNGAATVLTAIKAGTAQIETTVITGGGKPASLNVAAIFPDGSRLPLAHLLIESLKLN